jgi:hypothetical protein
MQTEHKLTLRSFVLGSIFAVVLCGVNSYLTLSFGIMEEGPAIAALFFFAFFFKSKNKITTTEMVIVATMGSAGGSLGFISNFFGAQAIVGKPYSILDMTLFAIVSSVIGLIAVIVLRQVLIVQDEKLPEDQRLPWVGAKAVKGVIDPLVTTMASRQPLYLLLITCGAILYILLNDDGVGITPSQAAFGVFGLSAYGAGVAFAPFIWGGSFLMGMRTCVGFFFGGVALLLMAPHLPDPSAPHIYVWPGIMFLVTSGMTALLIRWKVIVDAFKSLFTGMSGDDNDPIMGKTGTTIFVSVGLVVSILLLHFYFKLSFLIIAAMIVIGGVLLNLIATRAAAQTYFNPARVMGILLQGVCAMLGGASVSTNLTGAGFVAGSGAQGGNLAGDMAYGRWYGVFSRWQFWTQASTVIACSFVAAVVFHLIHLNTPLQMEGGALIAPIAKIWAAIGLLFDPQSAQNLPPFAVEAMWIGGAAGIVWALFENSVRLRKFLPGSIGFGLGLILPVVYDFAFIAGGIMMFYVLRRGFKLRDITLNTIAVACIVGEGLGGILQALLKILHILPD